MAAKWRPWRVAGGHSTVGTRSWRAGTYATTGADWPLVHDTVALGFRFPAVFAAIAAISRFAGGWLLAFGA
jgi:hypothetical protein